MIIMKLSQKTWTKCNCSKKTGHNAMNKNRFLSLIFNEKILFEEELKPIV